MKQTKKAHIYAWSIVKIEGLLAPKYPNLPNNLYANLRLLNDYGLIIPIKANKKARTRVCVCVCVYTYTMCQERTLCMFYTCEVQTFDQERAHSMSAVGFNLRFGLVILETQEWAIKLWG